MGNNMILEKVCKTYLNSQKLSYWKDIVVYRVRKVIWLWISLTIFYEPKTQIAFPSNKKETGLGGLKHLYMFKSILMKPFFNVGFLYV